MVVTIRPVRIRDAGDIIRILNPIIEAGAYSVMDQPETLDAQKSFIRSLPPRAVYLTAEDSTGTLQGIQDVLPDPGNPTVGAVSTFVALESLRSGVGSALWERTKAESRNRGYQTIHAVIRADNPAALGYYARMGFRVIAELPAHAIVAGRPVDEILTEKILT